MKRILSFLLLSFAALSFCQGPRFTYEYKFIPDSTNRDSILTERVVLQIKPTGSEFFGVPMYQSDSTMVAEAARGNGFVMPNPKVKVWERVEKLKGSKRINFFTQVNGDQYKVPQEIDLKWNILPEYSDILGYKSQKATTEFGGRRWTAWFTSEIPISDGPYKFDGLPGLIVKIEDSTGSHQFTLIGVQKSSKAFSYPDPQSRRSPITWEKYVQVFKNYREHPEAGIVGHIPDQRDAAGNFRRGADIERQVIKNLKNSIKKDNNIIELNLLKAN